MSNNWSCPPNFYNNCQNAQIKCKVCRAGRGSKKEPLFYSPINESPDLKDHPVLNTEDSRRRRQIYLNSRRVEKQIEREIAQGTLRSGAARGDGDISVLKGELRIEAKDRNKRSSWNLTWEEYNKGQQQQIDIFAISAICPDNKRRTMYIMEDHLFTELLALVRSIYESERNPPEKD